MELRGRVVQNPGRFQPKRQPQPGVFDRTGLYRDNPKRYMVAKAIAEALKEAGADAEADLEKMVDALASTCNDIAEAMLPMPKRSLTQEFFRT